MYTTLPSLCRLSPMVFRAENRFRNQVRFHLTQVLKFLCRSVATCKLFDALQQIRGNIICVFVCTCTATLLDARAMQTIGDLSSKGRGFQLTKVRFNIWMQTMVNKTSKKTSTLNNKIMRQQKKDIDLLMAHIDRLFLVFVDVCKSRDCAERFPPKQNALRILVTLKWERSAITLMN